MILKAQNQNCPIKKKCKTCLVGKRKNIQLSVAKKKKEENFLGPL